MKVTSTKDVHFPQFGWGVSKGAEVELPKGKEAQDTILAHKAIKKVGTKKEED